MPEIFKGAVGWNNAAGLAEFPESPDCDGIAFEREVNPVSGFVYDDGVPHAILRFPDIMNELVAEATLAVLGLNDMSLRSRQVTVRLPTSPSMTTWANYNAIAVRWNPGSDLRHAYCWYEKPVIRINRLVAL